MIDGDADDGDGDDLEDRFYQEAADGAGDLVRILVDDHGEPVGVVFMVETRGLAEECGEEVGFDAVGDFSIEAGDEPLEGESADDEEEGEGDPPGVGVDEIGRGGREGVCEDLRV